MKKIGSRVFFMFLIFALSFSLASAEDEFVFPVSAFSDNVHSDSYTPEKTFDGDKTTGWFTKAYPTYPVSISFDFGKEVILSGFDLYVHDRYAPIVFSVYSSNDNSTWELILNNEIIETGIKYIRFDFDNNEELRFLKIEESSADSGNYAGAIFEFRGVLEGEVSKEDTCEDSDEGKDYSVKGTTSGIESGKNTMLETQDYCITEGSSSGLLLEFFCSNNQVTSELYNCGDGKACNNGACVEESESSDYIIEKDFGEIAYEKISEISRNSDLVIDGLTFVSGETGHYSNDYSEFDVSIIEYSEDVDFGSFYSYINKNYAGMDIDYENMNDEAYSFVDDAQVLFLRNYDKDMAGVVIWTSNNYKVVFEYEVGYGERDINDVRQAFLDYLTKYKTSLVVDEDIFQCSSDYDCPSVTEKDCDGDMAIGSTYYSSCRSSKCEADGGSGYNEYCSNGCLDGECIEKVYPERELDSCEDLIEFVKSPYSFDNGYGFIWDSSWNDSYSSNWYHGRDKYSVEVSYSGFTYNNEDSSEDFNGGMWASYEVISFKDNVTDILEEILNDRVENYLCTLSHDSDRVYYLCNGSALYSNDDFFKNIGSYFSSNRHGSIVWVSGNNLIIQDIGYFNYLNYYVGYDFDDDADRYIHEVSKKFSAVSDSQDEGLRFLSKLNDNRAERIDAGGFYNGAPWAIKQLVSESQKACLSDVVKSEDVCAPSWQCLVSPVVCPEHGYQTSKCVDLNGCFETKESQQQCNPGICSGCTMNKWLGFGWSELYTKCMPYGARFDFEELTRGEDEILGGTHEGGAVNVLILDDYSATISINESSGFSQYKVYENEMTSFDGEYAQDIFIKEVIYDESMEGNGKILFTIPNGYNAYCDYDGSIKEQKLKDYDGSWATCQNNFECHSNLCSSGECIELVEILDSVSGLKKIGVRVLCRMADLFGVQNYDSCIIENLGGDTSEASSGGSGGGSSQPQMPS